MAKIRDKTYIDSINLTILNTNKNDILNFINPVVAGNVLFTKNREVKEDINKKLRQNLRSSEFVSVSVKDKEDNYSSEIIFLFKEPNDIVHYPVCVVSFHGLMNYGYSNYFSKFEIIKNIFAHFGQSAQLSRLDIAIDFRPNTTASKLDFQKFLVERHGRYTPNANQHGEDTTRYIEARFSQYLSRAMIISENGEITEVESIKKRAKNYFAYIYDKAHKENYPYDITRFEIVLNRAKLRTCAIKTIQDLSDKAKTAKIVKIIEKTANYRFRYNNEDINIRYQKISKMLNWLGEYLQGNEAMPKELKRQYDEIDGVARKTTLIIQKIDDVMRAGNKINVSKIARETGIQRAFVSKIIKGYDRAKNYTPTPKKKLKSKVKTTVK